MPSKIVAVFQNKHFLSLSGNVIMSGLGMLNMALLYRSLSISDAGVWVYFLNALTLIDSMRSGIITTAFIKFYAGSNKERSSDIAGSTWLIGGCITGLLVLLNIPFFFFSHLIDNPGYVLLIKMFSVCFV